MWGRRSESRRESQESTAEARAYLSWLTEERKRARKVVRELERASEVNHFSERVRAAFEGR